jgi:hypothetical protein
MSKPLNIQFDISDVVDEFQLTKEQTDSITTAACEAVTLEIYRNWRAAADRNLKSTREQYKSGLLIADAGRFAKTITLVGVLNNMLENGVSAFDMKLGFMKSSKIKFNKQGGWYLTVPFRIGAPGSLGESSVFSGVMPPEIQALMANKAPTLTTANKIWNGESLKNSEIPSQYQAPSVRPSVTSETLNKTFDAYVHKSSIYAGMVRNQKTYQGATQNTYGTFRRVGANSDPNSWINSGIKQYNLSQEAIENTDVQLIVDNTVDKILSDFGF